MTENEIRKIIAVVAVAVHRELVPGLLESVYEVILAYELEQRGLSFDRQVSIPIVHHGIKLGEGCCCPPPAGAGGIGVKLRNIKIE